MLLCLLDCMMLFKWFKIQIESNYMSLKMIFIRFNDLIIIIWFNRDVIMFIRLYGVIWVFEIRFESNYSSLKMIFMWFVDLIMIIWFNHDVIMFIRLYDVKWFEIQIE